MKRSRKLAVYPVMMIMTAVAIACADDGSGEDSTLVPTREVVTLTPEAIVTPVRPATPVPPTETPQDDLRNPDISNVATRPLPTELDPDRATTPMSEKDTVDLWTEFFTDSYFDASGSGLFYHFCDDGVTIFANPDAPSGIVTDVPDAWTIDSPSVADPGEWWEARFMVKGSLGPQFGTLFSLNVSGGQATTTFQSTEKPIAVYESEYCKQVVNDQLREIPPLLLADPLPNPGVQATLWNDYLRGGVLRSLDGIHTLNICEKSDGDLEGTATGSLVSGEEWGGNVQLENRELGWETTGLFISSDAHYMRAYLLRVVDGTPTLVPNANSLDYIAKRGLEKEPVELDAVPFEVYEGAACGIKHFE